jgi:hypothetical protein
MSFQGYIDNIQKITGKSPSDFTKLAEKKGFLQKGKLKEGIKAGEIVDWLKTDFSLGHGHSMAIYALFKGIKQVEAKTKAAPKKAVAKKVAPKKATPKKKK